MTADIFDRADYKAIIERIDRISANSTRRWGTMSVVDMLEHCSMQLKLALGQEQQSDTEGPAIMRTAVGRWLLLYVLPWTRGLPTPTKMNMTEKSVNATALADNKQQLLQLLQQVQQTQTLKAHPFFGALNRPDWGRLIWKHLDHHLKQFGC